MSYIQAPCQTSLELNLLVALRFFFYSFRKHLLSIMKYDLVICISLAVITTINVTDL
jgi:hypothetical protein